ncbi:MAG: ATP-binding protein [Saprospiraceae bacterium]|nr:ATP-binding protein [Saprospiraceae bacterium]
MIHRHIEASVTESLHAENNKLILLLGPRQTGKTTLIEKLMRQFSGKTLYLTGDDPAVRNRLTDVGIEALRPLMEGYDLFILDEAQRIQNIGITLKLMADHFPQTRVVATGSSSFELANQINEPLTGRKTEYYLFPVCWQEWVGHTGLFAAESGLEQRLLYGMYPEVLMQPGKEQEVLAGLASDNLYRDLLSFAPIRKPELLEQLLQALALQVGSEVSYNELSVLLKVDKQTVSNYITALEQAYVIFRLGPFSRNLRNEISTTRKVYFYDNGIRNALIGNFSPLSLRQDKGGLWENFLISERLKRNRYARRHFVNTYFWRTKQGQEIDYLEESEGRFAAYEMKWNPTRTPKLPDSFAAAYPAHDFSVISPEQFREFLKI